jgi:hypothetical protein
MINKYGAVGGVRIRWGNQSTLGKPAAVPICPPKIPYTGSGREV